MTQLEALRADYRTLTDNQKLFVIVEELDNIADRLAMMIDDAEEQNRKTVITNDILKKVTTLSAELLDYADYNESKSTQ